MSIIFLRKQPFHLKRGNAWLEAMGNFMLRLPTLAFRENQFRMAIIVGLLATVFYGGAGRLALLRPANILELSELDQAIPLLPWTFWIYVSVYLIFFASCWLQRDLKVYNRFLYTYLLAYFLIALFFLVYPTEFPRQQFPITESGISARALEFFRRIDLPNNCLPSMHVGTCVMSTLPFYRRRPWLFIIFCLWTTAIAFSTLTTKQHYWVDVFAGVGYALSMYSAMLFLFRRVRLS